MIKNEIARQHLTFAHHVIFKWGTLNEVEEYRQKGEPLFIFQARAAASGRRTAEIPDGKQVRVNGNLVRHGYSVAHGGDGYLTDEH